MKKRLLFLLLILLILCVSCTQVERPEKKGEDCTVKWAGIRVSSYGMVKDDDNPYAFDEFPGVSDMMSYVKTMNSYYDGSSGALIWLVGTVSERDWTCHLEFPMSKEIDNVWGSKRDKAEEYLTACDKAGYSVWLQVEPGNANLVDLATEVMTHYKNHPCVKGFGIDVEWYKPAGTGGYGTKLSDAEVKKVLKAVRAVNSSYTVFVKHWDEKWLPKAMDGLIYVNDSQGFMRRGMTVQEGLEDMQAEFSDWAETFAPQPVMFQIGYKADRSMWNTYKTPLEELGNFIADGCKSGNDIGIIWVDFTLKDAL